MTTFASPDERKALRVSMGLPAYDSGVTKRVWVDHYKVETEHMFQRAALLHKGLTVARIPPPEGATTVFPRPENPQVTRSYITLQGLISALRGNDCVTGLHLHIACWGSRVSLDLE